MTSSLHKRKKEAEQVAERTLKSLLKESFGWVCSTEIIRLSHLKFARLKKILHWMEEGLYLRLFHSSLGCEI